MNKGVMLAAPAGPSCCATVTGAPLDAVEAQELANLLSALADPVRLRLVSLVAANGRVCSCDLEEPLARSQPTISHHTKILAEAGLLTGEKVGASLAASVRVWTAAAHTEGRRQRRTARGLPCPSDRSKRHGPGAGGGASR